MRNPSVWEIYLCWFFQNFQKFFTVSNTVSIVVAYIFIKICYACSQGRNEVRWRPSQEASLAPPYSHLRSFGSKCTVLKKVVVTLLGLFGVPAVIRCPHSDLAPGELCPPWPPSLRPCLFQSKYRVTMFDLLQGWAINLAQEPFWEGRVLRIKRQIYLRQWLQNRLRIFKFEALFDRLL